MKIALAQYQPGEEVEANLKLAIDACRAAAASGAELICFNQFFIGLVPRSYDAALIEALSTAARDNDLAIITGNLVVDEKSCEASSAFFDPENGLAAYEPERTPACGVWSSLNLFDSALGPILVLTELEAYDSDIDGVIQDLKPKVIVMQVSAISLLELEAIKQLTIDRSYNQAHLILTVSMVGDFAGQTYLGNTMAVMQGEILGEAATNTDDLLIVEVDTSHFIDYQVLREPVAIPELLRQKLIHESSLKDVSGRQRE